MQGEKFVGYLPENIQWGDNSQEVFFSWNPDADTLRSTWSASVPGGQPQEVPLDRLGMLSFSGNYNADRTAKVFEKWGDIYLLDLRSGKIIQVTRTAERESAPVFNADGSRVAYLQKQNLFAWDLLTGVTEQLTWFQPGSAQPEVGKGPQQEWLDAQQEQLFEVLAWRQAEREARQRREEAIRPKKPETIYLQNQILSDWAISPDFRYVVYRLEKAGKGTVAQMPVYVTPSGYVEMRDTRVKVGAPEDTYRTWIYDCQRDTAYLLQTNTLPGIFDKPAYLQEYHRDTTPYQNQWPQARELIVHGPVFSKTGKAAVDIKSLDRKDRWIALIDLSTGALQVIDRQRDEAWIGGPGISGWTQQPGVLGWLTDSRHVYFQSEKTGYSHLYTADVVSGEQKALTQGSFEVHQVSLSRDGELFYITANAEGPHEMHFYHLPAKGGKLEKITVLPGRHEVAVSPNEQWLAIRYSFSNKPWELYLQANKKGAPVRALTFSTTPAFNAYPWREPEIVWFDARDGARVPARLYRPAGSQGNGPAVIFVHGAGYLQNVHKWWSTYYREYMFHHFLADRGFTVLDIDYRASEGYGRDWRTAIYRHMGGVDLDDQIDGAKYLVEKCGVNADRIGIYGGSYGGFITLMALFKYPGVFQKGAALRSVTDWAHYNDPYTANILNTPVSDSLAYVRSSPIYHAEGLQDELLILHGMSDDNVQFQDVVRLAQRLIELEKDNWEFAVYPVEPHGFMEPSSWLDEYKRIWKLFEKM